MKNSKIITSWDKILPGETADERMLSAILAANRPAQGGKEKVSIMSKTKSKMAIWIPIAACLVVFAAIAGIMGPKLIQKEKTWPEKHVTLNDASNEGEIYGPITKDTWDNTGNAGRYTDLLYSDTEYKTCALAIRPEDKGNLLGNAKVTGQDHFSEEIHEMDVKVFEINGASPKCVVAVHFTEPDSSVNGQTYVYAYMNTGYTPATLGDLIKDLGLEKHLNVGLFYWYQQGQDTIVFENVEAAKVLELLQANADVANAPDTSPGRTVMSIGVDYLGKGMNKGISLTEDGYLWTNILDTGKYFYIGKDKVDEFVDHVTKNCEGYICIYGEPDAANEVTE
jgi:hypothetical protein